MVMHADEDDGEVKELQQWRGENVANVVDEASIIPLQRTGIVASRIINASWL
jgi:hypothetical protein